MSMRQSEAPGNPSNAPRSFAVVVLTLAISWRDSPVNTVVSGPSIEFDRPGGARGPEPIVAGGQVGAVERRRAGLRLEADHAGAEMGELDADARRIHQSNRLYVHAGKPQPEQAWEMPFQLLQAQAERHLPGLGEPTQRFRKF